MYAAGTAIRKLSKRSNIPPCPGRILPESLTSRVRLNKDSTRSPQVPKMNTVTAKPNQLSKLISRMKKKKTQAAITTKIKPLIQPSHDFLGEIRKKSLCFPNAVPKTYAAVSFIQIKTKTAKTS